MILEDDHQDAVIEAAISQHNVYRLADDLSPRQRLFCQLIRDADKLDIFKSVPMDCGKVRTCGGR